MISGGGVLPGTGGIEEAVARRRRSGAATALRAKHDSAAMAMTQTGTQSSGDQFVAECHGGAFGRIGLFLEDCEECQGRLRGMSFRS